MVRVPPSSSRRTSHLRRYNYHWTGERYSKWSTNKSPSSHIPLRVHNGSYLLYMSATTSTNVSRQSRVSGAPMPAVSSLKSCKERQPNLSRGSWKQSISIVRSREWSGASPFRSMSFGVARARSADLVLRHFGFTLVTLSTTYRKSPCLVGEIGQ